MSFSGVVGLHIPFLCTGVVVVVSARRYRMDLEAIAFAYMKDGSFHQYGTSAGNSFVILVAVV